MFTPSPLMDTANSDLFLFLFLEKPEPDGDDAVQTLPTRLEVSEAFKGRGNGTRA